MPRTRKPAAQLSLLESRTKTAPCVPSVRKAVEEWRDGGYKGVTPTTRTLLNHWFRAEHRLPGGRKFAYHPSQREAVETLVFLFEVAGIRRHKDLLETYASQTPDLRLLQHDEFTRYCVKMATGSGKTKVLALAVAWQYFNAVVEGRQDYAPASLLIAPNVIVFERLRSDFAGGRIFRADPIIPPELQIYWDFEVYLRGEGERAHSEGALYLTNIQQLHEREPSSRASEPDIMTAVLGTPPPARPLETEDFDERLVRRGRPVLVLNDEAHHTHDEKLKWNEAIRALHAAVPGGVAAQLDFSATPRYQKGSLFTWTVYDYPLKQAILDGVVKRPVKGVAKGITEIQSDVASTRYQTFLTAGVERWREYRQQLAPLGRKPVLFVMMNGTADADDVADFLRKRYPSEFSGEGLQVIHTDLSGQVSKKELDRARKIVREVDDAENPVNAIVSVLMLREGWDVQNVTVVVGLRPYSSRANILPEQAIGRGLRLMFRGYAAGYQERVDIIGNRAFLEFVEQLEKDEDLELDTFEVGKEKLVIVTIQPDPEKLDRDISLPSLSPILARKKSLAEEIAALDVQGFDHPVLPRKQGDAAAQAFRYEGYDILTLEKLVERDYTIPEPQTPEEVISYYAKRIAQEVKLPSQFAALVPRVREFLQTKAFGEPVDLAAPGMVRAVSSNVASYVTVKTFVRALRAVVVEELEPQLLHAGRKLSETPAFPYSRATREAAKTVFNLVPCDNEFERKFAGFLESAEDVEAFAKLPDPFGFTIQYTDSVGSLRYYEPDFVARLRDGAHYLIETKGREDPDVPHKDRAARIWCENAARLTGTDWIYLKVLQKDFDGLQPDQFADLAVIARGSLY
jgi:type III restriction enzyme